MKACVSLIVAMLCGLAWAGKSCSGGHGSQMDRAPGHLTEVKWCPNSLGHFDLSWVEVLGSVSLKSAGDVEELQS